MVNRDELNNYCANFLSVSKYKDYCPNGLQVEGSLNINKIVSGVSANLDLIELAIDEASSFLSFRSTLFLIFN